MLHEFISAHRNELIARTRAKVARRGVPAADRAELEYGVPIFLKQLTQILSKALTAESSATSADMAADASRHGDEMLREVSPSRRSSTTMATSARRSPSSRWTPRRKSTPPSSRR